MRALVQKFRKQAGLKQGDLAATVGITRPYLSQIENGERRMSLELQKKFADALGIDPAELVDFSNHLEEQKAALLTEFRQLSQNRQSLPLRMARCMREA